MLEIEALVEAARMVLPAIGTDIAPDVLREVAWLHWLRHCALLPESDGTDIQICLDLFSPLAVSSPAEVPPPVLSWLEQNPGPRLTLADMGAFYATVITNAALALGDSTLTDLGISACRAAAASRDDADRPSHLFNLMILLHQRYELTAAEADLNEAVEAGLVASGYSDHPIAEVARFRLGLARLARFELRGQEPDLSEGTILVRAALASTPPQSPDRVICLSQLAVALQMQCSLGGELSVVEEYAEVTSEFLALCAEDDPIHANALILRCNALRVRFLQVTDTADIAESIRCGRAAVVACPPDHELRVGALLNLAGSLHVRYGYTRAFVSEDLADPADLTEAIELAREADAAVPAGHPLRWEVDTTLAAVLRVRSPDRAGAVQAARATLTGLPADSPHRGNALLALGDALRVWYKETGAADTIRESVAVLRAAKAAGATGQLGSIPALMTLSMALHEMIKVDRAAGSDLGEDLDEAIEVARLVAGGLADPEIRGQQLWQLSELLQWRFQRAGNAADLDERIEVIRAVVPLAPNATALTRCLSMLAALLGNRYSRARNPADIDESANTWCRVVETLPADNSELPDMQAEAALALLQRFEVTDEPADQETARRLIRAALDATAQEQPKMIGILGAIENATAIPGHDVGKLGEVIEMCRAAVGLASGPEVFLSLTLGNALMARYENTGHLADLESATETMQGVLPHVTGPGRGVVVNNLLLACRYRFYLDSDVAGLTEGIGDAKAVLRELTPGTADALLLAANIAALQSDRYERVRDLPELTEAIDTLRAVISQAAADSRAVTTFRLYLGNALRARFQTMAEPADLDEAATVLRAGLASAPRGDTELVFGLMLGFVLSLRGQWTHDPAALAESAELLRAARAGLSPEHTRYGTSGVVLASTLRLLFVDSGDLALLNEAIEITRDVIARTPDGHINTSPALIMLGILLTLRFERTGEIADVTEAIEALRGAVAAAGANNAVLVAALPELANALRARQGRLNDPADLDEAIAVARRVTTLPEASPAERGVSITALATALLTRSMQTGDLDDLNTAIDLSRAAMRIPNWHIAGAVNLMTLGLALWIRFDRRGIVEDLNAAIDSLFEAAAVAAPGHTMRPIMLTNLCNALRARAALLGSPTDLDAAVETGRAAVAAAPEDHPAVPLCLMNLGMALLVRHAEKRDDADLDGAVAAASEAVDRSTPHSPNRAEILLNLAGLLRLRRGRGADDINRAVALVREAIAITDPGHPLIPQYVLNLSITLRTRYSREGDDADAAESIELARQVIDTFAAAGDPRLALAWMTLGQLHERRNVGEGSDLDTAFAAYRTAAELPAAAPMIRAGAARTWAELAVRRRDWTAATEAFGVTVALLPQVAWHGVERDARERRLTIWGGLATEAAAAALAAGDPSRAVELLEQGRSVLWSQALQTRDDLSLLRERDLPLYERLRAVATTLAAMSTPDIPDVPAAMDPWSNRTQPEQYDRIKLAGDWDRLLAEARALPGLEHLLRVPPLTTLRDGLPDGPVVLLNLDRTRCDALIVRRDRDVEHVPLPDLSKKEAAQRAGEYLNALKLLGRPGAPVGAKQILHATLEWLWDTVADPVLTRLGYTGHDDPLPRLWWCPTGSLTLLPLHAAGYHDPADTPAGRTVIDRVVSSYTPTLRALARANAARDAEPGDGRVLVVSMPETPALPTASPLPGARAEAEFFARTLPEAHTLRIADSATHVTVTADLQTHAYAHFACHGGQNLQQPSTGALYLQDKPLTVLDVAELDLSHAELAYLSACSTAVGGTALPDEAIHLAAALQLAGYRHVIATLWTITDRTAAEVTTTMYTGLLSPAGIRLDRTARLLHRTVRALRDSAPRNPAVWASYIHFGP
ncbi:hypothetical protein JOF56_010079 [Kibdelosporangium banguiense]|uniref:CHAT domain-containing protein n=1 Tax=Kibdelosporangium banguiense TaxID=1365924 RepID=A0ABS4U0E7_9PSEU|nr:CHAT domain-containing protein [Kibdelosporangium banguiense]MBP2329694.1 hypothetical protein [Kibdelosporangium banguiense]